MDDQVANTILLMSKKNTKSDYKGSIISLR